MSTRPASAVYFRGHWFDPTTRDMLAELARLSGALYVDPIQGCWSTDTEASGSTHDGACVGDINAERWTDAQAREVETLWRSIGGFGWFRPVLYRKDGSRVWQRHLHLGRNGAGMAPALATQYQDYLAGYNGLPIGNRTNRDTGTRAYVTATWADYLRERDDMSYLDWPAADRKALAEDVRDAILGRPIVSGLLKETVGQAIGRTSARVRALAADPDDVDVAELARQLAPLLPAGTVVDQDTLTASLRELLGSLDAQPTA